MTLVRLNIESISDITEKGFQQQNVANNRVVGYLTAVNERVARVEEMLLMQSELLQANQNRQVGQLYNIPRRGPPSSAGNNQIKSLPPDSIRVRVTPQWFSCRDCPCDCHSQKKVTSPALLNRILGRLFVDYTGVPVLKPKCSTADCLKSRSSQLSLEYWFPLGFFSSTIVRMQLGYKSGMGTLFQLDTLRRVPDTAQCVNFALHGDVEGLKYLFSNGLASPRDVSTTRGYSLLRWALYGKQYTTCEFLLTAGADPDYKPIATTDNNPRNKACHFLLEGGLSSDGESALRAITRGGYFEDFIDEAKFTQTHKIILGLSLLNLEEEITLYPGDINVQDAMGRTPLAWAAAKGDNRAVVTLLSHGADPNITDVQASGPVSNAAARGHTACVRLLLEAGAQSDPVIPGMEKKGSPLNCAARNATDVLLLKSLLDFGANIESCGVDGQTSLIHASRNDNSSFAMLLLEYGANLNAVSATGATPLTTAITFNSHNVLRLMLDRWHEYSVCPRLQGPHLLQIIALYADIETMHILAASHHLRSSYDNQFAIGDFRNRICQRPDVTEALITAFDELLSIINETPDLSPSVMDLESGVASCPATPIVGKTEDGGSCLGRANISRFFSFRLSDADTSVDIVRPDTDYSPDSEESFKDALDHFY